MNIIIRCGIHPGSPSSPIVPIICIRGSIPRKACVSCTLVGKGGLGMVVQILTILQEINVQVQDTRGFLRVLSRKGDGAPSGRVILACALAVRGIGSWQRILAGALLTRVSARGNVPLASTMHGTARIRNGVLPKKLRMLHDAQKRNCFGTTSTKCAMIRRRRIPTA